jgi:hypothetical protein
MFGPTPCAMPVPDHLRCWRHSCHAPFFQDSQSYMCSTGERSWDFDSYMSVLMLFTTRTYDVLCGRVHYPAVERRHCRSLCKKKWQGWLFLHTNGLHLIYLVLFEFLSAVIIRHTTPDHNTSNTLTVIFEEVGRIKPVSSASPNTNPSINSAEIKFGLKCENNPVLSLSSTMTVLTCKIQTCVAVTCC